MFTQVQNPTPATSTEIKTMSVKDYFTQTGVVQVNPTVATNVNGYPFITVIDAANKAENIYFSKRAAASYPKNTPIVKGFFDELQFVEATNEAGEVRIKLSLKGGNRLDAMSLL
tara:strand:+ start:372 stop:713 length:342 start_codon:yes stop_codon:yes gene_type:complete